VMVAARADPHIRKRIRMRDTISPDLLIPEQKTFFIIDVI